MSILTTALIGFVIIVPTITLADDDSLSIIPQGDDGEITNAIQQV